MLVMLTMLVIALLPSGDAAPLYEHDLAGLPALCYFKRLIARSPEVRFKFDVYTTIPMLISITVLLSGYLTRIIKLSRRL